MRQLSILVLLILILLGSTYAVPVRAAVAPIRPSAAEVQRTKTITSSVDVPENVLGTTVFQTRLYSNNQIRLYDDRVLITGGTNRDGCLFRNADVYDPATGTVSSITPMNYGHERHNTTTLFDGRVLIGRGLVDSRADCEPTLPPFEVFEPRTNTFTVVTDTATLPPTATLLDDGRLVVVRDGRIQSYDPTTETTGISGTLTLAHTSYALTALADQRVLLTDLGGSTASEVYDPATGEVMTVAIQKVIRDRAVTTLLNDGRVLIVGYSVSDPPPALLFDPTTGTFSSAGTASGIRRTLGAVKIPDGRVMIMGYNSISLFDPATLQFKKVRDISNSYWAAFPLPDGTLAIYGRPPAPTYELIVLRYVPGNHFDGSLVLPAPWMNQRTFKVFFQASSTGAPLTDYSIEGGGWQPLPAEQPITATVTVPQDGKDVPVRLSVRDQNGREALVVYGRVNIDTVAPRSRMGVLPTYSRAKFEVNWSYDDATSGVRTVAVEAREGQNGAWRRIVDSTTATSTTFSGADGVTYSFRVRATDEAGNVEAWPDIIEAQTTVDSTAPYGGIDVSFAGDTSIQLLLAAADQASGVREMRVGYLSSFGQTTWERFVTSRVLSRLGQPQGCLRVAVQYRDQLDNRSPIYTKPVPGTGCPTEEHFVYLPLVRR